MGPGPGPMGPMGPGQGRKGSWNDRNLLGMTEFPKSSVKCLRTSEVTRTQNPHQRMPNEIIACIILRRSYDAEKTNLRKEWFGPGQMVKSGKGPIGPYLGPYFITHPFRIYPPFRIYHPLQNLPTPSGFTLHFLLSPRGSI